MVRQRGERLAGRRRAARHRSGRPDRAGGRDPLQLLRAAGLSASRSRSGSRVAQARHVRASATASASSTSGADEAAAQGEFIHVYVDRDSRRPVAIARPNGARRWSACLGAEPRFRRGIFAGQPVDQLGGRHDLVDRADALARSPDVAPRLGAGWPTRSSSRRGRAAARLSGSSPAATIEARR